MTDDLSRRRLGRLLGLGAVAAVLGRRETRASVPPGVVGLAPIGTGDITPEQAGAAMGRALVAATGAGDAVAAARTLFRPDDVVGIKVNALAGRGMSPRPVVVAALAALLREAGVAGSRVIIFDRSSRELRRAGFAIARNGRGPLCYGIDNDYDRLPSTSGSIGSCYATLVSSTCTALVSFGVLKDHDLSGISAGMKNWYGVIHNPNKYHDDNCDPFLADVVRHPFLRDRIRLTVLDAGTAQYHGGPAYRADATFAPGLLAASADPLACDAWGWRMLDAERRRRGLPTLEASERPPTFLATAAGYGLGVGDPAAIRQVQG